MLRRQAVKVSAGGAGARPSLRASTAPAASASSVQSRISLANGGLSGGVPGRRAFVCRATGKGSDKKGDDEEKDIFKSMAEDIENSGKTFRETLAETSSAFKSSLEDSFDEFSENIQERAEGVTQAITGVVEPEEVDEEEEILGKEDDWADWTQVMVDAWGEEEPEKVMKNPGRPVEPPRPRYPGWLSSNKRYRYRDEWLNPMIDRESLRQRLFMSEEQAAKVLDQEAAANAFESQQGLKFAALLIGVPLATSYMIMKGIYGPVLHHALESGEAFNLSFMQEVKGAHEIHVEEMRMRMDITLGRAPPLTDDEMEASLRDKALEVMEEMREENEHGLLNFVTDATTIGIGTTLLVFDSEGRSYLWRTTKRVVEGISDLGKAFVIILVADTMVGYHSAEGWEALISVLAEHYNFTPEHAKVNIFIATVPVLMDALFKLWLFQGFVKGRGGAAAVVTLKAMDRH